MKIAITSDIHVHKWQEFSRLGPDGKHDRLKDCLKVFSQIKHVGEQRGLDTLIIAGDLFHKRVVLDVETFNDTLHALERLKTVYKRIFLIAGNHDQATKDGRITSTEAFEYVGVGVIVKPWTFAFDEPWTGKDSLAIDFFPYTDDAKKLYEEVKIRRKHSYESVKQRIAIMHHGFKGARVGSALEYVVKEPVDALKVVELGKYDYVFSGHYHTRQNLAKNVMYIGSPLEHTRSDKTDEPKGFLIYDTDTRAVEVVPIKAPRFVIMQYGGALKKEAFGNFIDLVMPDMSKSEEAVAELVKYGARGVKPIPSTAEVVEQTVNRARVDPTMSIEKAVKRYVKWCSRNKKLPYDKQVMIDVAMEIISGR